MTLSPDTLRRFGLLALLPLLLALVLSACAVGRDTSSTKADERASTAVASDGERPVLPPSPPVVMGTADALIPAEVVTTASGADDGGGDALSVREGVGARSSRIGGAGLVATDRVAAARGESAPSGAGTTVESRRTVRAATKTAPTTSRVASASTTSASGRAIRGRVASASTTSAGGHAIRGGRSTETSVRAEGVESRESFDSPLDVAGSISDESAPAEDHRAGDKVVDRDVKAKDIDEEPIPAPPVQRSGQLTAGEWNDLRDWNFWNGLMSEDWGRMRGYWKLGSGARITVQAQDGERPVIDAVAELYTRDRRLLWSARTDNHGIAELYTGLDAPDPSTSFEVVVKSGEEVRTISDVKAGVGAASPTVQARFRSPSREEGIVDVMFAIDATGSMGDELEYIKAEVENVVGRVRDHAAQSYGVRVAANVYRDVTDDYLVRPYPFTQKMDDLVNFLRRQSAGGGGDTPEAVESALADAIDRHEWSPSARARILFLVLDAPPHHTDDRLDSIAGLVRRASEKGIHIIPVASSGVDKETEFLLRMLGTQTNGTYVFLTDHSGIGNSHIKPTIGDYKVEFLNDLLVRLIIQYSERYDSMSAVQPRVPVIR